MYDLNNLQILQKQYYASFFIFANSKIQNILNLYLLPSTDLFDSFHKNQLFLFLMKNSFFQLNFLSTYTAAHFPITSFCFRLNLILRNLNQSQIYFMYDFQNIFNIYSLTSVSKCSNWLEREIFDMFGISSTNHPQLRRILTDYGFKGFPLRKDFPVYGYKELWFDFETCQVVYYGIRFSQTCREYDFSRQWEINHCSKFYFKNINNVFEH